MQDIKDTSNFIPIEIPPSKQAFGEFTSPIALQRSKERLKIPTSPQNYIMLQRGNPGQVETSSNGKVDCVKTPYNKAMMFCAPSDEFVESGQRGQDAGALLVVNGCVLGVFTDGKGSAYLSDDASTEAALTIAIKPQLDLQENLNNAAQAIRARHLDLPHSASKAPLIAEAQDAIRTEEGSSTLIGQILVNMKTGNADGLFLIDGGVSLYRKSTRTWEHYSTGEDPGAMSLKSAAEGGLVGKPKTLAEIVGDQVILERGDIILGYTDGGLHIDRTTGKPFNVLVEELLVTAPNPDKEIAQLMGDINKRDQGAYGDDTTFFSYKH